MAGAVQQWLQLGLVPGVAARPAHAGFAGDRPGGVQEILEGLFKPLRAGHGARIFWGDLHRLAGVWSIWFIAVISITGTWFLIQAILADNHITFSSRPIVPVIAREDVPQTPDGSPAPRIDLDEAARIAGLAMPGLEINFIALPATAYSHVTLSGPGWYPLMFQSASVNPYTRNVDSQFLISDRSALEFVTESMRPLHTGDFGGLPIKLVWFFFGLVLTLMVFSGLLIWTKRTAQATAAALKRSERAPRPARRATPWRSTHEPGPSRARQPAETAVAEVALSPQHPVDPHPAGLHAQVLYRRQAVSG